MLKIEALALAISVANGGFDPGSKAFKLCNPGLLKTYRPEKKVDSENYRVFSTMAGGFKAFIADLTAKATGKNPSIAADSALKELLLRKGFKTEAGQRHVVLFLRRALEDESISGNAPLSFFVDTIEEGKEI